jgi:peptidoglycan/LPS O-acetylase OafA/YrhL
MYLSGVIVRLYRDQLRFTLLGAMVSVLLLLLGAVVSPGWIVLFPIAGTYLLFWLAFTPALRLRNFGRHGDFSYGTYLYGFPVQQVLAKYWGVMNPYAMFLAAAPLAMLFALASWKFVERPFLNRTS